MGVGRGEAVQHRRVIWRRRTQTKVVQQLDESFESAVHRHDLADARRRRGEVSEMGERVEQRERGVRIQCYDSMVSACGDKQDETYLYGRRAER